MHVLGLTLIVPCGAQVFRRSLHTRLIMFMVQIMAFSYAAFIFDFMMDELIKQTSVTTLTLSVSVPLLWTLVRSLNLAFNGETINNAVSMNACVHVISPQTHT